MYFYHIVLILANSADSDEMQQYAAIFLGFHCLPKYQFRIFSSIQGLLKVKYGKVKFLCLFPGMLTL